MSPQDKYNHNFGVASTSPLPPAQACDKLRAAFTQASDIRKFEIELYWTRAGYFWALIAVAFAGYFAILSAEKIESRYFLSFVVCAIGSVFTFAWFLVNRGSKYWQENWENHLDLLEDEITGPLYKTRLERPPAETLVEKLVTGPLPISVSKINQWVSVFVLSIWIILAAYSFHGPATVSSLPSSGSLRMAAYVGVAFVAFCAALLMVCSKTSGTHQDDHFPTMRVRKTTVTKEI